MSTNENPLDRGQEELITNEPEENLALTAYDPSLSSLRFDREHGDEVDGAIRELTAYSEIRHAA
jgi:hypothetical protein